MSGVLKFLLCYKTNEPWKKIQTPELTLPNGQKAKVEALAEGQQFVGFGIHPDTNANYTWDGQDPLEIPAADLPLVTQDNIRRFVAAAERILRDAGALTERELKDPENEGRQHAGVGHRELPDPELVRDALGHIPNDFDYDGWIRMGFAIAAALGPDGCSVWEQWSATSTKNDPEFTRSKWESLQTPREISAGTLFYEAKQRGWRPRHKRSSPSTVLEGGDSKTPKPMITLQPGDLPGVIAAIETAILADTQGPTVFQRAGELVWLKRQDATGDANANASIFRVAGAVSIAPVSTSWLRLRIAGAADFQKLDTRTKDYVAKDPSLELAAGLEAKGDWPFPNLVAVIETPTLRRDSTVLDQPGYDALTRLYLELGRTSFPAVALEPTRDDAIKALGLIEDVIKEFPFVDEVGRSVAVAAILTGIVRRTLRTSPLFVFDAPTMGSGKTLLADIVAIIATGRSTPAMTYTGDEAEDRKRVTAILSAGDPFVLFDNIGGVLKGDVLSALLTSEVWQDRILGSSQTVTLPNLTTWMATGNNLTVAGDLATRVLICRIDPGVERPEERSFERANLRGYVVEHRATLVHAALTAMRAFIAAGRPKQDLKEFGRFEEWSDLVRSTLVWAGRKDPCASRDRVLLADPEREGLGALLVALKRTYFDKPFKAAQVVKDVADNPEIRDALEAVFGDEVKTKRLTWWLNGKVDRIVNGLKLVQAGNSRGQKWRIVTV